MHLNLIAHSSAVPNSVCSITSTTIMIQPKVLCKLCRNLNYGLKTTASSRLDVIVTVVRIETFFLLSVKDGYSASSSTLRDELIDAVSLALICGGVALDIELVEG